MENAAFRGAHKASAETVHNPELLAKPDFERMPKPTDSSGSSKSALPDDSKYVPSTYDVDDFEKYGGNILRSYSRQDLEKMSDSRWVTVARVSKYLLKNFDTVSDLTSGGGEKRVGINDIRLLAEVSDAKKDMDAAQEWRLPYLKSNFGKVDTNHDGVVTDSELRKADDPRQIYRFLSKDYDVFSKAAKNDVHKHNGISLADIDAFQSKIAFESVKRELHKREDLDNRAFFPRLLGKGIGYGVVALARGREGGEDITEYDAAKIVEKSATINGYFEMKMAESASRKHYEAEAAPALKKLLK
jgi:hypothetical protein